MLFAHLTVFIGSIASLLFIFRIKSQLPAEKFLSAFSAIFSVNMILFLSYQYYNFEAILLLDYSGVITELICLSLPVIYLIFLNHNLSTSSQKKVILVALFMNALAVGLHFLIADDSGYLFYHTNKNAIQNVQFQIVLDILICVVFIYNFLKILKNQNKELFDGNFKSFVGILFIAYYLQDLMVLLLMAYFTSDEMLNESVFHIGNIMNFLSAVILVIIAIQTNWLQEWNFVFNKPKKQITADQTPEFTPLRIDDLKTMTTIEYNELKHVFSERYGNIFIKIDATAGLSKTEKLYFFFLHFEIAHKELADLLHVSNRTVETNFYRLRKKIETNSELNQL